MSNFKHFLRGMGQSLDLGATMNPRRFVGTRSAQKQAIGSYWRSVGGYMNQALREVEATRRGR